MENEKVILTGDIPQCPNCKKPTQRIGGSSKRTLAYYRPSYDENGKNTNPDRNTTTTTWGCIECGKEFKTARTGSSYYYK